MPPRSVSTLAIAAPPTVPGLRAADTLALVQAVAGSSGAGAGVDAAAGAWPAARVLDGRHVAVLAPTEQHPSAEVFSAAATALGARVARIVPADLGLGDTAGAAHTARLLADLMTLKQALHGAGVLPPARVRLGVYGPPRSGLLRAWRRTAVGMGIDVIDLSAPGADARRAGCQFACQPAVPPELLVIGLGIGLGIGADSGVHTGNTSALPHTQSLADRQRCNHGLVVQALLRNALGARR